MDIKTLLCNKPPRPGTMQIAKYTLGGGRLEFPADPGQLPGGTFVGMGEYIHLAHRCCAALPGERPTTAQLVEELQRLRCAGRAALPAWPPASGAEAPWLV